MKTLKALTKQELTRLNELLEKTYPTSRFEPDNNWGVSNNPTYDVFNNKSFGEIMIESITKIYKQTYSYTPNLTQHVIYDGRFMSHRDVERLKV